ncbi:MAG: hypothetical protein JW726_16360 [Anaerolineales bacterium]|nr:hypothetical protein [Anaerolineales bacterium]
MQKIITNILESRQPLMMVLRLIILGFIAAIGVVRLRVIILAFEYFPSSAKDVIQEYLLTRAMVAGVNPYLPLDELAARLVSPITWSHYYVMLVISLVVLLRSLARQGFPIWQTILAGLILLMMFLVNEHIQTFVTELSGGDALLKANGSRISFAASLLTWLPILQVIGLVALLARLGAKSPVGLPTEQAVGGE